MGWMNLVGTLASGTTVSGVSLSPITLLEQEAWPPQLRSPPAPKMSKKRSGPKALRYPCP